MGRPKKNPTDAQLERIEELSAVGAKETAMARVVGVSHDTWARWKKESPRLVEALDRGRADLCEKLVGALVKRALDPKNPSGMAAAAFLLKNLAGWSDQGRPDTPANQVAVVVQLPAALRPEQYAQLVEAQPRRISADVIDAH